MTDRGPPLLDLVEVSRTRGRGPDRFSLLIERLAVRPGDRLAIVGANGSGKSTCLDLLALTLAPSASRRFAANLDGTPRDLAALWLAGDQRRLATLRAGQIGYVLQSGGLLPFLDVRDNIGLPLRLLRRGAAGDPQVDRLLERLGIAGLARRAPAELSLGERQRVAVARALVHRPRLVLADEPTASLDRSAAAEVMALFIELVEEGDCATILVTHDAGPAIDRGFTPIACVEQPTGGDGRRSVLAHAPG